MPGPLLLADVPWLLYRSFFALPRSIVDAEGVPVGALLGTVNALLSTAEALGASAPRAIVACLGAEEAAYRVRLFPGYHAHRDPMPPELAAQWERAPGLLASFGWTLSGAAELEADDVMYSHARAESERGGEALLLTGDRDLYGAVDEHVAVLELKGRGAPARIGPAEVQARAGVQPGQIPDLIALRGDPSDGIPGAPGIGAKTAAELLGAHGSLEGVLAAAHEQLAHPARRVMRVRIADTLREHDAQLRDFKRIATLQRIDVEPPPERATDFAAAARAARELGMKRLAERLGRLASG